jgi:hypothetical protein
LYRASVVPSDPAGTPSPASISATVSYPSSTGTSGIWGCSMWALSTIRKAAEPSCSITNCDVRAW